MILSALQCDLCSGCMLVLHCYRDIFLGDQHVLMLMLKRVCIVIEIFLWGPTYFNVCVDVDDEASCMCVC